MVKTIETTHDKSDIIIQLLNAQKARQFREEYLDLHVYEQAQIFTDLTEKQRARLYRYLTAEEVGDMFDAIEEEPEEVVLTEAVMSPDANPQTSDAGIAMQMQMLGLSIAAMYVLRRKI